MLASLDRKMNGALRTLQADAEQLIALPGTQIPVPDSRRVPPRLPLFALATEAWDSCQRNPLASWVGDVRLGEPYQAHQEHPTTNIWQANVMASMQHTCSLLMRLRCLRVNPQPPRKSSLQVASAMRAAINLPDLTPNSGSSLMILGPAPTHQGPVRCQRSST